MQSLSGPGEPVAHRSLMERFYLGQARVLRLIAAGQPLKQVLTALAVLIEELEPSAICSVLLVTADGLRLTTGAAPTLAPAFCALVEGFPIGPHRGSCGTAAYLKQQIIVTDIATDPLWEDAKHFALPHGLRACWSNPILDSTGNVLGTFAIYGRAPVGPTEELLRLVEEATDLARVAIQRDRTEQALRRSEERHRSVIETVGSVIIGVRPDHTIFEWNQAAEKLFLTPRAEALGEDYLNAFVPEQERAGVAADIQKVLSGMATENYENNVVLPDGNSRTFLWNVTRLCRSDGVPEGIIAIGQDITDRKTAEARLALALESVNDTLWDWNIKSGDVYFSPRWAQMLGCDPDEVGFTYADWEARVHPDDLSAVRGALTEHLTGGRPQFAVEYRARAKDGSWHWFLDRGKVVARDATGQAIRAVGTIADVTERHLLETQLRHAQKMEAIGQLAGGVAHDFNNLLTAIVANLDLVRLELPAESHTDELLREAAGTAKRAASLTTRLLALSRRQGLHMQAVDLNRLVFDASTLLLRVLGGDVVLETALAPTQVVARVDPGQIEQVLLNLAVNARDAMPVGGTIVIETAPVHREAGSGTYDDGLPPGDYIRLSVRDAGTGMDAATQARIFEPFFTTKEIGKGTGLGLTMVYSIVTQSGGAIHLDSQPGLGSTFTLLFPATTEAPTAPRERPGPLPRGTETILLVEDESAVRSSLKRLLEHYGYRVIEARHGADALIVWKARRAEIDLVLSDVRMPELGGAELAAALHAEAPELPLILMSGYSDTPELERARGHVLLEKPISSDLLLQRVRETLDRRSQPRRSAWSRRTPYQGKKNR